MTPDVGWPGSRQRFAAAQDEFDSRRCTLARAEGRTGSRSCHADKPKQHQTASKERDDKVSKMLVRSRSALGRSRDVGRGPAVSPTNGSEAAPKSGGGRSSWTSASSVASPAHHKPNVSQHVSLTKRYPPSQALLLRLSNKRAATPDHNFWFLPFVHLQSLCQVFPTLSPPHPTVWTKTRHCSTIRVHY